MTIMNAWVSKWMIQWMNHDGRRYWERHNETGSTPPNTKVHTNDTAQIMSYKRNHHLFLPHLIRQLIILRQNKYYQGDDWPRGTIASGVQKNSVLTSSRLLRVHCSCARETYQNKMAARAEFVITAGHAHSKPRCNFVRAWDAIDHGPAL